MNNIDPIASVFGLIVYVEFLRAGITGMPDINGVPATEFDTSSPRLTSKLPKGYGDVFGAQAMKMLQAGGLSLEVARDTLSDFQLSFLTEPNIKGGHNLQSATYFVMTALRFHMENAKQKTSRRAKYHAKQSVEAVKVEDPSANLDAPMTADQIDRVTAFLTDIHPDLPAYFKLAADGIADVDAFRMLPGISAKFSTAKGYAMFNQWKNHKVLPALRAYVNQGAV
jgi:hypothetical protein